VEKSRGKTYHLGDFLGQKQEAILTEFTFSAASKVCLRIAA
jgi:hypothetical protein